MDPLSTAPPAPSQGHKTYVFVDEYNRHKRLKVMRACDGCRKRKIRCDGALQNGPWPCGACVRLKLKCVPPTLDGDDEQHTPDSAASHYSFRTASPTGSHHLADSPSQPAMTSAWPLSLARSATFTASGPTSAPLLQADEDKSIYHSHLLAQQQQLDTRLDPAYAEDEYLDSTPVSGHPQSQPVITPSLFRTLTGASNESSGDPEEVDATVKELSEQMGDLSIDVTSVASYIAREQQLLAETPAVEEQPDVELPPSVSTDLTVHIPLEMMPHEERAMDYFGYFFNHIHPYVPVLHREQFYEQWRTARHAISPLILEGVFACVAHYLEDPIEVRRWLALASRHEESFKDVPRLSTVQGLLLLAKAREAAPRRGYYFRSWMHIKYVIAMATDLGLHEHRESHLGGEPCKYSSSECTIRTRIWQTLFLAEGLIGGSQGRSDFSVDLHTVDVELPRPSPELSDFEYLITRRTCYMTKVQANIKLTNNAWQRMRKITREWALVPEFVRRNDEMATLLRKLPPDMQIEYAAADGPPLLRGKHYVAYIHIYHHLTVIMHMRPQLQALLERRDPAFQQIIETCNESAISICRLQEALYRDFGLHGLHFMQRGIGFTIYTILTCTMLHLATITAPDATTNARARMFFTRHMLILEHCIPSATPEIQVHIGTLREAFSQDISKPFELKAGLGRRSSSQERGCARVVQSIQAQRTPIQRTSSWTSLHEAASSRTLSNASDYGQPYEDIPAQPGMTPPPAGYTSVNLHQVTSAPHTGYALEPVISNEEALPTWDPSGIFSQWNAAFGPSQAPPPPPQRTASNSTISLQSPTPSFILQPPVTSAPHAFYPPPRVTPSQSTIVPAIPSTMPAVTPVMWQDAFATAYVSGQGRKRYREESVAYSPYDR